MRTNELTPRQKAFIEAYLSTFSCPKAAKLAGYGNENTTYTTFCYLGATALEDARVKAEINDRLAKQVMDPTEVLTRLSEMARANIADFIDDEGNVVLERIEAKGYLIRSYSVLRDGRIKIDLHDAKDALIHIARYLGLFEDRIKIIDWKHEAEEAGVSSGELFDALVGSIADSLRRRSKSADGGSTEGSEEKS